MKKLFMLIIITVILLLSCTVNETMGIIKVENRTYLDLKNVWIGDTLIAGYVAPGGYVNYYYYQGIKGQLSTEGIKVDKQNIGINYDLKLNYWVYITADYDDSGEELVFINIIENNTKY